MFVWGASAMNLKYRNGMRPVHVLRSSSIKEERQRTGRYIAILVGISLFLLALYHAWVRRIPIVASLVVPALIMFFYVGWVLYTASRDKHKLQDAEAALRAAEENDRTNSIDFHNDLDVSVVSIREHPKAGSPNDRTWVEISSALTKGEPKDDRNFITPIILVNDRLPEDFDEKWAKILETVASSERFKTYQTRRKFKRKFCRSKRHAFKRSYSIG